MGRWLERLAALQGAREAGEDQPQEKRHEAGEHPRQTRLLHLVHHEHRCRCGRTFRCTAPSCAGWMIPCVVCRLENRAR